MIELLDMNKAWAKVKAGLSGGKFWKQPAHGPNPSRYEDGIDPKTQQAMQFSGKISSAFTGKTFSNRK
jgi:hypothetical protein